MGLFIPGPAGRLEAELWEPADGVEPRATCAFCHPHPLHGGTMRSSVVFRAARGLQEAGLAVLRFDFRGVGKSEGEHDGAGGEEGDLAAALEHLAERWPAAEPWAGGFSFGARTAGALAERDPRIRRVVLVAPPVLAFDVSFLERLEQPGLVVCAEEDEFGGRADLLRAHPDLAPGLEVEELAGVDHFFTGRTRDLQALVRAWAERALATSSGAER